MAIALCWSFPEGEITLVLPDAQIELSDLWSREVNDSASLMRWCSRQVVGFASAALHYFVSVVSKASERCLYQNFGNHTVSIQFYC
jgi:hypothetical protein